MTDAIVSRALVWRVVLALALIAVTWASLSPMPEQASIAYADKVFHVGAYIAFYLLAWRAFPGPALQWRLHVPLLIFGVVIEVLQGLTAYRSMEALDLLADATGLGLGCLLLSLWPGRARWLQRSLASAGHS